MQALGGFFISVLNIVTLAASGASQTSDDDNATATDDDSSTDDNSIYNAALMFFAISVGTIVVCFSMHHVLLRSIG